MKNKKTNIWTTPAKDLHKGLKKIKVPKTKLKDLDNKKDLSYDKSREKFKLKFGKILR